MKLNSILIIVFFLLNISNLLPLEPIAIDYQDDPMQQLFRAKFLQKEDNDSVPLLPDKIEDDNFEKTHEYCTWYRWCPNNKTCHFDRCYSEEELTNILNISWTPFGRRCSYLHFRFCPYGYHCIDRRCVEDYNLLPKKQQAQNNSIISQESNNTKNETQNNTNSQDVKENNTNIQAPIQQQEITPQKEQKLNESLQNTDKGVNSADNNTLNISQDNISNRITYENNSGNSNANPIINDTLLENKKSNDSQIEKRIDIANDENNDKSNENITNRISEPEIDIENNDNNQSNKKVEDKISFKKRFVQPKIVV